MATTDRWLLPSGIEEILAPEAWQAETLRREVLDLFNGWGYDLVIPPHLEFWDSLNIGLGSDLEIQTFKLTDQLTGRTLALRADTTPAVARLDAHTLKKEAPVRLCYAGSVFHTRPTSLGASRSPIQLGAELYGHSSLDSDIEVISLMLETLKKVDICSPNLDLGHAQIYRTLAAFAELSSAQEQSLFEAIQRKSTCEVEGLLCQWRTHSKVIDMLVGLPELAGDEAVIHRARQLMQGAPKAVFEAIDQLEAMSHALQNSYPGIKLYFDLGELRGYNYHTGPIFTAYAAGKGQAIAKGGRYDGIGQAYGQARPATGFSTDLKLLMALSTNQSKLQSMIYAPIEASPDVVKSLRNQGRRVISELPNQNTSAVEMGCDHQLANHNGRWVVEPVS